MKNSHIFLPRQRGIVAVRADSSNPQALIEQINRAFNDFREQNDRRLADLERGREDVVTNEHVERINASITDLTNALNTQREQIDALRIGGGAERGLSADAQAHANVFNNWFRRGEGEQALGELQVRASLTSQSDPDGGFLVPREVDQNISRVLSVVSALRGISRVVQIGTREYSVMVSKGGAAGGWVGEEESRPETATPTLAEITIQAMELYANPSITQRMLDDPDHDVAQWLAEEVAITFGEKEGAAFVSGTGIKQPRGFLSYDTVDNASYAWGSLGFVKTGAAAAFNSTNPFDAVIDLFASLKEGYRTGAVFVTSDATLAVIRKFKDGQGNYFWSPPTADQPGSMLGKPVITDDNMPALAANAFPLAFGNFQRGYTIVERMGSRVLRDPYINKPKVHFYTTKRVGAGVTNYEAIKLLKCST